jgi:predicted alpha/beta superfamily hydrolase
MSINILIIFIILILFSVSKASVVTKIKVNVQYPSNINTNSFYLRGSDECGLNWDNGLELIKSNNSTNLWSLDLTCNDLPNNYILEVKVLVQDKVWMLGANHHINASSVSDTAIFPWFYNTKGTMNVIKNIYSSQLHNYRDVIFYFPPSFNENTLKSYKNVLIMHDGQNLFDPKTAPYGSWNCQKSLDSTIISGTTDEIVIVGAYNTPDRNNEYTYVYDPSEGFGGKGDLYLDWIEDSLIPLITNEPSYRLEIQRETLGILGSSLGGLISCYAAWTRPNIYGKYGCMSSSFWWDNQDFQNNILLEQSPKEPLPSIYMDSGNGSVCEVKCTLYTSQIYEYMSLAGFKPDDNLFQYVQDGGEHNEASWGSRFYIPIQDLYPSSSV